MLDTIDRHRGRARFSILRSLMTEAPLAPVQLPIIDFAGGLTDRARDTELARAIDEAFSSIGFCYFVNTGVPQALMDRIFAASKSFHALSAERKAAIKINGFHRGYMAPNTSLIETSSVAKVTRPNYSESFMLMHEVREDEPRYGSPLNGPNQWPADLPDFRADVEAYDAELRAFCTQLLRVSALALNMPAGSLDGY